MAAAVALQALFLWFTADRPVGEGTMIVEGWASDHAVDEIVRLYRDGRYAAIITTGIPLSHARHVFGDTSWADIAADALAERGVPRDRLTAVSGPRVARGRTEAMFTALRRHLRERGGLEGSFELVSVGPHARRSAFVLGEVLGPAARVGVVSLPHEHYTRWTWWTTSEGVKSLIAEAVGLPYAWVATGEQRMSDWIWMTGAAVTAYLLGAIPFGWIMARSRGVDLRKAGSGNIGATNVFRNVGKFWGIFTFALDFLKGFAPAFWFAPAMASLGGPAPDGIGLVLGLCAVAGHNWPVFLGFRGGKGVATSAGMLTGLAPAAVAIAVLVWALVFALGRYVSLASMAAALAAAAAVWGLPRDEGLLLPLALSLLALVIVWKHRGNIARLAQGREHRFSFGKNREPGS